MVAHADFIYRLADLGEYAKDNDLMVASLALNAAYEVITPSIDKTVSDKINAPCVTRAPRRPMLRVIAGGLSTENVDWHVSR